jgi:hypothetical protein
MHIIPDINKDLAFLQSPLRSHTNEFIAYRLEEFDRQPHIHSINCVKTLFYRIAIFLNDSVEFIINNGSLQTARAYTLCFLSPFHYVSYRQRSDLQGQSFQFSESFIHCAYESTRFHIDFPFFWSDHNCFFINEQEPRPLIQLGEKIINEYDPHSRLSENFIRDYLHIFLLKVTEGLNKLKDLDRSGDIVHLPGDSQLTTLLYNILDQPLRLASNIFLGLLEGFVNSQNGPADLYNGLPDQFNQQLRLSTFSVLLDAEEDNPSHIDEYMRPYQGVAWRSNIVDLYHNS